MRALFRNHHAYGVPNTIDLLKLLALVTMTVDHVGEFLFHDVMWFRVIGRASFPIWLFVVGYHAAVKLPNLKRNAWMLLLGCVPLVLLDFVTSHPIFPISILLTIFCVQALLSLQAVRNAIIEQPLTVMVYILISMPLFMLVEYGSLAMLFAMLGYLVRRDAQSDIIKIVGFFAMVLAATYSNLTFHFSSLQEYAVIAAIFAAVYGMMQMPFKPWNAPPRLCLLTRNTYWYYLIHFLLLESLAALLYPPEQWFALKWF